MYVKYLVNRIKSAPAKMWNDWKVFRNYPGMEYRDVHDIIPKSHMWKFPSQGSIKYDKRFNPDYFKWDYKTPYRDSTYFARRIFPDSPKKSILYTSLKISNEDIDAMSKRHPNWKDHFSHQRLTYVGNEEKTLEEKHEEYGNLVQNMFETRDLTTECKN